MEMRRAKLQNLAQSALFAAVLCILSPVAIPVGPVPLSLGVFAVMLAGVVLEWKQAAAAALVYLMLGAIGLPVFSGGGAGFGVLIGPTGGYLWCYLPMVMLVSHFSRKGRADLPAAMLSAAAAMLLCYALGTVQFMWITDTGWAAALGLCVWPFLGFDILKIVLAALLGLRIRRQLRAAGLMRA